MSNIFIFSLQKQGGSMNETTSKLTWVVEIIQTKNGNHYARYSFLETPFLSVRHKMSGPGTVVLSFSQDNEESDKKFVDRVEERCRYHGIYSIINLRN